jgi:hypothetical protein
MFGSKPIATPTPADPTSGGGSKTKENLVEIRNEIKDMFGEFSKAGMSEPKGAAAFFQNLNQQISGVKENWATAIEDLGTKWAESSAKGKEAIKKALNEVGIAFKVTEEGKLDATTSRVEMEKRLEQQKQESILEYVRSGQLIEDELRRAANERDLTEYTQLLSGKNAAFLAHLEGERQFQDQFRKFQMEANRSELSYMAEASNTLYTSLSQNLTDIIMGTRKAGDAFKSMGAQMISMVLKWVIQRKLAATMGAAMEKATAAASASTAMMVTAAWSKAAAMVSLATMGANAGPAMAGMSATMAGASAMSLVPLAKGGIVTGPTAALIGEGRDDEMVLPLNNSILSKIGGGGDTTINVYNNTGTPVQARSERHVDGTEMVVSLILDGLDRNVGGLREILESRRR